MEEKERYLYIPDEYECAESYIYDNNNDNEYNDLKSICNLLNQQDKESQQLKQQLEITEKALELCERHHIGFEEATVKEQVDWRETRIKENIEYFKTKAKEMLENE